MLRPLNLCSFVTRLMLSLCLLVAGAANGAQRLGSIDPAGSAAIKEGSMFTSWTALNPLPSGLPYKDLYLTEARIAALDTAGNFFAKEGAVTGAWILLTGGVQSAAISGNRVVFVSTAGVMYAKEGSLYASWLLITGGAQSVAVSQNRLAVITTAGALYMKEGSLADAWISYAAPNGSPAAQVVLTPNRVALRTTSGAVYLQEGPLSPTSSPAFTLFRNDVKQVALTYNRIALLMNDQSVLMKEGAFDTQWSVQRLPNTGAEQLSLSDGWIALRAGGNFLVKEGALSNTNWTLATGYTGNIALSEYAPFLTTAAGSTDQTVYSWATSRCAVDDIPDTPARAFRDSAGTVNLVWGNSAGNRRMLGPNLDAVARNCTNVLPSQLNADPAMHSDREWIHGLYSTDGAKVYALVHNEYHGWEHPGMCPSTGDRLNCWKTSTTLAVSENGGLSFQRAPAPNHSVAWLPYPYDPSRRVDGLSAPSNIFKHPTDGFYYATVWAWLYGYAAQSPGMCLLRTNDLGNPKSWRAWDGSSFSTSFYNPDGSPAGNTCYSVARNLIPAGMMPTQLFYSATLRKYVLLGYNDGVYMLLSDDLVSWGLPTKVANLAWPTSGAGAKAYAAILDPLDMSRNFDAPGATAYLYNTVFVNPGPSGDGPDRNVVRRQVIFDR